MTELLLMQALWMAIGLGILIIGADLLVRGASALAIAMSISPLVVGLTVVAFGTGAPELVISLNAILSGGKTEITIGNVIGSNIFNILVPIGMAAVITPLVVSRQLVRFEVPFLVMMTVLFWIFSFDGFIGWVDGVIFSLILVVYTYWVVYKSRKEEKANRAANQEETPVGHGLFFVLFNLVLLGVGLAGLVFGANLFLGSAIVVAKEFELTDLVIGLTLVAVGTSLPEVATSVVAAFKGEKDLAVGNAIGSSLFNILGVLGISSIVATFAVDGGQGLSVSDSALQFNIPVMIAVAIVCMPVFFTGHKIAKWEGILFVGYYIAYTVYLVMDATGAIYFDKYKWVMGGFVIPMTVLTLIIGVYRSLRGSRESDLVSQTESDDFQGSDVTDE